jgi:excisionase family DNA binding protein
LRGVIFFDTYEAAKYLGISHWMVRKHLAAGHIAGSQLGRGGHWIIQKGALDDFLAGRTFRRHRNRKFMPKFAIDLSGVRAILAGEPGAPSSAEIDADINAALAALEGQARV